MIPSWDFLGIKKHHAPLFVGCVFGFSCSAHFAVGLFGIGCCGHFHAASLGAQVYGVDHPLVFVFGVLVVCDNKYDISIFEAVDYFQDVFHDLFEIGGVWIY